LFDSTVAHEPTGTESPRVRLETLDITMNKMSRINIQRQIVSMIIAALLIIRSSLNRFCLRYSILLKAIRLGFSKGTS